MTVDAGELPELVPTPPGERLTDAQVWGDEESQLLEPFAHHFA